MKDKKDYEESQVCLVDKLENKIEIKAVELSIDPVYKRAKVRELTKRVIEKGEMEK